MYVSFFFVFQGCGRTCIYAPIIDVDRWSYYRRLHAQPMLSKTTRIWM